LLLIFQHGLGFYPLGSILINLFLSLLELISRAHSS
jgi:hypothetical protein